MGKLAIKGKVYKNDGSHEVPSWTVISGLFSDFAMTFDFSEAPTGSRDSRVDTFLKATAGIEYTGKLKVVPGNAVYEVLASAFYFDTEFDLLIMLADDKDTVGARGVRANFQLYGGGGSENLQDSVYKDFRLKPTDTYPAQAVKVAAGPTLTYAEIGGAGTFA